MAASPLRRAVLLAGASLLLASIALLVLSTPEPEATLASSAADAPRPAAWTPAPLLALLILGTMSALVLVVAFRPRRN